MPVTFQVVGNLADFGNDVRAGVKVRATATPGVKVGDVAVHSNVPETATTDVTGAFTLTLVSLPGVWYRITTPYANAINTVNLAGYVPDVGDPTTGTVFPALTVINLKDVVSEDPTPGYDGVAMGPAGADGAPGPAGADGAAGPPGATGPAGTTEWAGITDKPAVIGAGATQSDARTALGVPNVTIDSLTWPQIAAHRCGPWLAGESTLASAEIAVAGGIRVLETDFAVTADGVPILSHGLTLDESTNGTGTIKELAYGQIANTVQVDPAALNQAPGYANQPVTTVDELLYRYLGRAVILLENKLEHTIPVATRNALSARWESMGAKESVVIQTFSQSDALQWIALGWRTMLVDSTLAADPVALAAAGYWGVAYPFTGLGAYPYTGFGTAPQLAAITAAKAAGLIVGTYTHRYKHESDAALAAGADIAMSDHPLHALSGPKTSRVANFASNVFPDGVLGYASSSLTLANGRLSIATDGPNEPHAMIGCCGPITETSFTVSMRARFESVASSWMSLFIQGPTDAFYKTQSGYHLLLRATGTMDLYRFTAPATSANIGTLAGAACVADTDYTVTLRVTPTQVIATRVDTGGTITVADSTHRPAAWWPHVGRSTAAGRYSLVSVTGG